MEGEIDHYKVVRRWDTGVVLRKIAKPVTSLVSPESSTSSGQSSVWNPLAAEYNDSVDAVPSEANADSRKSLAITSARHHPYARKTLPAVAVKSEPDTCNSPSGRGLNTVTAVNDNSRANEPLGPRVTVTKGSGTDEVVVTVRQAGDDPTIGGYDLTVHWVRGEKAGVLFSAPSRQYAANSLQPVCVTVQALVPSRKYYVSVRGLTKYGTPCTPYTIRRIPVFR